MKRVLLIEPDKVLLQTHKEVLENAGYKVTTAYSAQSAVIVADAQKPDLIVLEVQLVEHSGIEFLYELRSYIDWQSIPVIINTMVPPGEFKNNYQLLKDELGVILYLYKPHSSLKELLSSVREVDLQLA